MGRDARRNRPIRIIYVCAVIRHGFPVGASPTRPSLITPAGGYRSGGGGNEAVGAFETHVPLGGAASRQAVTRVNTEQASKAMTWEPTRYLYGEGRRRWGNAEVVE